jgi:hypothetical protein
MTGVGRDLPVAEHLSSVAANVSDGGRAVVQLDGLGARMRTQAGL